MPTAVFISGIHCTTLAISLRLDLGLGFETCMALALWPLALLTSFRPSWF